MNEILKRLLSLILRAILRIINLDGLPQAVVITAPKRVLLVNPAHIGDIVISTSLLPVLKSAYPNVEIGFITGSWSHAVIKDHPLVTYSHIVDHWRFNRKALSLPRKIGRYFQSRAKTLRELRGIRYDVAIHLQPGFFDLLSLSCQARIPLRASFSGGLWAPLATYVVEYPKPNKDLFLHHGAAQSRLLSGIGIDRQHLVFRKSNLAHPTSRAIDEVVRLFGDDRWGMPYDVIHIGAGQSFKEASPYLWREVASLLSKDRLILFTGYGGREARVILGVMHGLENCINACDQLSWYGFVAAVRFADTVYGVDSVSGHVAAALGTRSVNVYHGAAGISRWRPEGDRSIVWTNPVSCSPCYRKHGCSGMLCMRVEAAHVVGPQPLLIEMKCG